MEEPASQTAIGQLWAGRIFGTNTGKVFLRLSGSASQISGTVYLADDDHGNARLEATGSFVEGVLKLSGTATEAPGDIAFGTISIIGRLQSNGQLRGEWVSDQNTAGTFYLFSHTEAAKAENPAEGPEQLYTASRDLGALRLYRNDIIELIRLLERDFRPAQVIISHFERGTELSRYANDFESQIDQVDSLDWIKLTVQVPHVPGINRVATIDLGPQFNRITTQGPDESWVLGEAEALSSHLRKREKRLYSNLGRYRVGFNQIIALAALVAMPDLPMLQRAVFISAVLVFLWVADKLQRALIPNLIVRLSTPVPGMVAQSWPSILSFLISTAAGVAASVVYGLLTKAV